MFRYYVCTRLVLLEDCNKPEDYNRLKYRLVSNRKLAEQGRRIHIDRIVRSRSLSQYWGECSKLRYSLTIFYSLVIT